MNIAAKIPKIPTTETSLPRLSAAFFVAVGDADDPVDVTVAEPDAPVAVAPEPVVATEVEEIVLVTIAVACGEAVEMQPSMQLS